MPCIAKRFATLAGSWRATAFLAGLAGLALAIGVKSLAPAAMAQDMTQYLDLKSDEFTKADLSREDIENLIAASRSGDQTRFPVSSQLVPAESDISEMCSPVNQSRR